MPRAKRWKVVLFTPLWGEEELGRYLTREIAIAEMQAALEIKERSEG